MAWAVRQKLPCTQKIVLLMLAERHNKDTGQCNPSHDRLADDCGLSRRSVMDQVARLEEAGYIRIRHRAANNVKLPNQYVLVFSFGVQEEVKEFVEVVNEVHQGSERGALRVVQDVPGVVNVLHHGSERAAHKPGIEPGIEPKEGKIAHAQAHAPSLLTAGLPVDLLADFQKVRKAKRAGPLTDTALKGIQREADAAGLTLAEAVTACCELGWQSFNATWYANRNQSATRAKTSGQSGETAYQRNKRLLYEAATGRHSTGPAAAAPFNARAVIDITPATSQGALQ